MTGYAAIGAGGLALDVAGRHYTHQLLTGENEGWDKSASHGVAGLGAVAAIMGTRSVASKFLFRGVDAEAAGSRMLTELNLGGDAATGKLVSAIGERTALSDGLKALQGSLEPVMVDGALNPKLAAELAKYSPAQLSNLTGQFIKEGAAANGAKWYNSMGSKLAGANPLSSIDLATATSGKLGMRSFYSGYTTALAGTGTYGSIAAMDTGVDPVTGKPMTYAESFMKTNFNSMSQNVFTEALMVGMMPAMKDGALAKSVFQEGAGLKSNAWSAIKSPWSATTFGSMGTDALTSSRLTRTGLQAGQMAFVTTYPSIFNITPAMKTFGGWQQSKAYGAQLDAMGKPITDQAAPTAAPTDTQVLNQKPAGQTDAPATQTPTPTDNGQPIKDQPVDTQQQQQTGSLTQGTPGLGG
jgi:hypothetical protein